MIQFTPETPKRVETNRYHYRNENYAQHKSVLKMMNFLLKLLMTIAILLE